MPDHDRHVALLPSRIAAVLSIAWLQGLALTVAAGAIVVAGSPSLAAACGPTLPAAHPLSPPDATANIPLNAVLIASSTFPTVRFTLREVGTGRALAVSTACDSDGGVRLCQGRPGLLAANTAYVWTAVPEPRPDEVIKPGATPPVPRELGFTTGSAVDDRAPLTNLTPDPAPLSTVDILEHMKPMPSTCGVKDLVRLRIAVPRLDEAVVLAATGMGGLPFGPEAAELLTPQVLSTERTLYAEPGCMAFRLLDVAGNVSHLPPWCPPATTSASGSVPGTTEPPTSEAAACAATPGGAPAAPSGAAAIALLLATIVGRRRRS